MSQPIPTYSFLPWLRVGVANNITQGDGDAGVKVRATMPLDLTLHGAQLAGGTNTQVVHKDVSLYGPGDIVGIDSRAIVKVDPHNWITNFEPNYLPYIDFYDEDFPWRYTPAAADQGQHRLRPWITLVVLKESEFTEGQNIKGKPLPFFELNGVTPADVLPVPAQLWAWAHVHVNKDLSASGDTSMPGVLTRLQSTLQQNPDEAYSRIICPRRLEPTAGYHAFLIPTFETGRLAGLGEDIPAATVATTSAWAAGQTMFPYYYRWFFKTGTQGDFEFLVGLLKPKPADKRVGVRDIDVLHPGPQLPPINVPAELQGVLKLGGALRVPVETLPAADKAEVKKYDEWDEHPYPHPFEQAMAARINLADDYERTQPADLHPADPDPVITSPLYGRWHALVNRLLREADNSPAPHDRNWIHELNLDPRFRVAAGLGTKVIQQNQEEYMNAAWQQVGDVIEANNQLRLAQVAFHVSYYFYWKHVRSVSADKVFVLTAPVHKRVVAAGLTVYGHVQTSVVPQAALSAPFRQLTRPGAPVMKRLGLGNTDAATKFVPRLNDGTLVPAPPKVAPPGAIKVSDAVDAIEPHDVPRSLVEKVKRAPWLRFVPLVVLLILLLLVLLLRPGGIKLLLLAIVAAVMLYLFWLLTRAYQAARIETLIGEDGQTPASVDEIPPLPNFVITEPGSGFQPRTGDLDSEEGRRFKLALRDAYSFSSVRFPVPEKRRLDLPGLTATTLATIDPARSIPARTFGSVAYPAWLVEILVELFAPVMAYPVFDLPMYKPLSDLSAELFLPNINLIPPNSLTLLESNQKFIESYMVGLNHEMSRELLWREYPTDQRGSYFRQFWDVNMLLGSKPLTPAERDKLRDIPELHLWSKFSNLGQHNQRETEGDDAQLVLVIRGELLKKYPTAVIYAQKAKWHQDATGALVATAERELVELTAAEEDMEPPPPAKLRKPLFEAKVAPDIYFFGFNLNAVEARGGKTVSDDPGWFFVIKERPGEPRFGFDFVAGNAVPRLINWNNLSWNHIGTPEGKSIELNQTLAFTPYVAAQDQENKPYPDDAQAQWTPNTNAAELAYILYQVPVLVAVHASRMLP